jgi:YidC/Oxa1 family membrane protein insertase
MHFLYYTVSFENYGVAIILFTILTRLAMLPLTIKQYQSTAKMQKLQPKIQELQRQYRNDKQRLQEETVKLYQTEKINPMGGCLPLLIQLPIIMSLWPVIQTPLRYMVGKTVEQITALTDMFRSLTGSAAPAIQEMELITYFRNTPSAMAQAESAGLLQSSDLLNMNFLGIELSRVPTYDPAVLFGENMGIYLPLLLIPIIGVVSTFISGKISMAASAAQSAGNQQAASMNKSMQFVGPVMTLIFSFQMPAGILVYWTTGYLIQIAQQLIINKYMFKLKNIFTGEGGVRELPSGNANKTAGKAAGAEDGSGGAAVAGKSEASGAKASIEAGAGNYAISGAVSEGENGTGTGTPQMREREKKPRHARSSKKPGSPGKSTSYMGKKKQ